MQRAEQLQPVQAQAPQPLCCTAETPLQDRNIFCSTTSRQATTPPVYACSSCCAVAADHDKPTAPAFPWVHVGSVIWLHVGWNPTALHAYNVKHSLYACICCKHCLSAASATPAACCTVRCRLNQLPPDLLPVQQRYACTCWKTSLACSIQTTRNNQVQ